VILGLAALFGRGGSATSTPSATAVASATAGASSTAAPSKTPLVVPTAAIALPQCPPSVVPEVDNPARYGFCVPTGWGAYNENNSLPLTELLRPHPGDANPVILPTDFSRIQIVIALNTSPPTNPPAECAGPANDTIAGLPAHHCTASLDPAQNPYHANEAQFWRIELPQNRSFYITAQSDNATADDLKTITAIVHLVKPLGNQ
jgi:hypothetical protein